MEYIEEDVRHKVPRGGAVKALKWIYQSLGYAESFQADGRPPELGKIYEFDQSEFVPSDWSFEDS